MGRSWGCFLIRGVESRTKPARAAKEVERTHPNPVPEGTASAAADAAADPWRDGYAAAFSR